MDWMKPRQEDVMVPCKKCGNKVPASTLRLDLDEKKMICPDCIKNKGLHKEIHDEQHKKAHESKPVLEAPQVKAEAKSAKIGHKCHSCGYKFMIDSDTGNPKNCPYCNERVISF